MILTGKLLTLTTLIEFWSINVVDYIHTTHIWKERSVEMYGFLLTFEGLWSHGIIYVILRLAVTETRESVKKRLQRFDVACILFVYLQV